MMETANTPEPKETDATLSHPTSWAPTQPLVVTVTGEYAAGSREVATAMADRLGLLCYDTALIDRITGESLKSMEEVGRSPAAMPKHDWLHQLRAERGKKGDFTLHLVRTIMGIGSTGGVIIGNGAHLILFGLPLFRIKVEAGVEYCARRVVDQEGISFVEAKKKVVRMNRAHMKRVREVFEHFPNDRTYYDLVLSAERFPVDEMVEIAMAALAESGLMAQALPLH